MRVFTLIILSFLYVFIVAQNKKITLPLIWASDEFIPKSIKNIKNLRDGKTYTILENNVIVKYSYDNKELSEVILDGNLISEQLKTEFIIQDYAFSRDEKLLLLATNIQSIYRYSYSANYYVFWTETKKILPLSSNGSQQLADFSPFGSHIAFVRDNNIHIVDLSNMTEKRITHDGEKNIIINGMPDWVYEEEFGFYKGFHWAPDGSKILYYRFDESNVKEYNLFFYSGNEYPQIYTYKYPKAGESNSVVELYVYDLIKEQHIKVETGDEADIYIPRIGWTKNNNIFWFQRLNRLQNKLEIFICDAQTGQTKLIYQEENPYYIEITDNLYFFENKKQYLLTSEKNGYNHIYIHSIDGKTTKQITSGDWDVSEVIFIDEKNKWIYYTSKENGPENLMLYRIDFDGKYKKLLFESPGYYNATFSTNGSYFVLEYSNSNTPTQYSIYNYKLNKIIDIEKNDKLIKKTKEYGFVNKEFFSFTTSENVKLHGWMMKPAQIDLTKKHPVLVYVYGGPGSQTVLNKWGRQDYIWFQMLVQKGFIVVSIDGRGTGGKGQDFKKCTYLKLGYYETIDQIEAIKYLHTIPFIDKKRIAIFGWSYGGYLSLLCMTRGADYFYAGIAVAPVTNWRYYDNIYTERYMRKPQENSANYDENSPIHHIKNLKSPILIIHGDSDDNVHVQNTMEFVNELCKYNKQFEMMIYPNRNHGLYGGYTRLHLYTKITDFLEKHLLK